VLVIEAVEADLRIFGAPLNDLGGVTVVQQVDEHEIAVGIGVEGKELFAEDGRADDDAFFRDVGGGVEGEGELGGAGAEEAGVEFHAQLLFPQFGRPDVAGVLEHELMADGDDGRAAAAGDRVKGGDGLEKIDDHVRLRFADEGIEPAEDAGVFGEVGNGTGKGGDIADGTVVLILELQCRQLDDGRLHRRFEVGRHRPLRTHAEGHGDYLMTGGLGHFLDGHRLGHVPPALAQYAEHHFHGSG